MKAHCRSKLLKHLCSTKRGFIIFPSTKGKGNLCGIGVGFVYWCKCTKTIS